MYIWAIFLHREYKIEVSVISNNIDNVYKWVKWLTYTKLKLISHNWALNVKKNHCFKFDGKIFFMCFDKLNHKLSTLSDWIRSFDPNISSRYPVSFNNINKNEKLVWKRTFDTQNN